MEETPFNTLFLAESSTLAVFGFVDESAVGAFRDAIRFSSGNYRSDLVVDLSEVQFLPSLAIGVLVGALKASVRAGSCITIVARPGSIARRVLDLCGIEVAGHDGSDNVPA